MNILQLVGKELPVPAKPEIFSGELNSFLRTFAHPQSDPSLTEVKHEIAADRRRLLEVRANLVRMIKDLDRNISYSVNSLQGRPSIDTMTTDVEFNYRSLTVHSNKGSSEYCVVEGRDASERTIELSRSTVHTEAKLCCTPDLSVRPTNLAEYAVMVYFDESYAHYAADVDDALFQDDVDPADYPPEAFAPITDADVMAAAREVDLEAVAAGEPRDLSVYEEDLAP